MAERKRSLKIATLDGTKDYLADYGQSALPPLMRPVKSARELQSQFLERKYPFVKEVKEYPPYVLVYSNNQNGFFLLDTKNKKAMNQVLGNPEDLCEIVGDTFWPPRSEDEQKQGLTCQSLIPGGSTGKLGIVQQKRRTMLEEEYKHLQGLSREGMSPEMYSRLYALEKHLKGI